MVKLPAAAHRTHGKIRIALICSTGSVVVELDLPHESGQVDFIVEHKNGACVVKFFVPTTREMQKAIKELGPYAFNTTRGITSNIPNEAVPDFIEADSGHTYSGTNHKLNVWVFEMGWTAGIDPTQT